MNNYKVIKAFTDKNENSTDENGNKHIYYEGDLYPFSRYAGATVQARLDELVGNGFIELIEIPEEEEEE